MNCLIIGAILIKQKLEQGQIVRKKQKGHARRKRTYTYSIYIWSRFLGHKGNLKY